MSLHSLTTWPAFQLADAIRERQVSARDVVEAHIAALRRWQPKINALAVERFEQARQAADAADRQIEAAGTGDLLPPLLGVACTIKEIFNLRGMPHTAGLIASRPS